MKKRITEKQTKGTSTLWVSVTQLLWCSLVMQQIGMLDSNEAFRGLTEQWCTIAFGGDEHSVGMQWSFGSKSLLPLLSFFF